MNFFEKMIEVAKSMGVKNFAYYKKWALDHLKKQLEEDKQVTKAIEYCEEYLEKAYGVGTIRTWKGKKYIKGPDKKWRRYYDKKERGTSIAIAHIMKQINALEDGDVEGLYAIIQKNAGRFRDQNGNVLPEVQQIHDLVEKKQSGNGKKEEKPKLTATQRYENGIRDEKYEQARKDAEMRNQNENKKETVSQDATKYGFKSEDELSKRGYEVVGEYKGGAIVKKGDKYTFAGVMPGASRVSIIVPLIEDIEKVKSNVDKTGAINEKRTEERKDQEEKETKRKTENEMLKEIPLSLKETVRRLLSEIGDSGSIGSYNKAKTVQYLLKKEGNGYTFTVDNFGGQENIRKIYSIPGNNTTKEPEETEQEKHDNRSNAMKGNDNAKKDGVSEEEVDPIKEMLDEFANDKKLKAAENKVNMETFSSDDCEGREFLCGTYFEDGLEITTEGHVLAAIKSDYNEENENKIKANKEYIKYIEKKLKKLEDQKERGFANLSRKLENDAGIEKYKKILETKEIDGKFPNWRRVVPDQGDMTSVSDSFKNVDQIMKYCLVAEKMNPGKVNVSVKVGGKLYDPKYLFNALAMAKKNGMTHFEQEENRPLHIYNEKGDIVVMPLNYSDSYLDAESGKQNISSSTALPRDIYNRIRGPVEDTPEVAEKNKEFEKYGYRIKKMKDGTWAAGYKKEDGSWLDGGLRVNAPTMEDVVQNVQAEINRKEESKKQEEKERAEREKAAKEKRGVEASYGSFFDGKSAREKGRIMKQLEKNVTIDGKTQSYKNYIEEQFKNGDLEIGTHEEDKLSGPSRRAFNRMTGREQEEAERRVREAGKITVYEIRSKSKGNGYYKLGKTVYDYAKYLLENGGNVKKSFLEQIEEISKAWSQNGKHLEVVTDKNGHTRKVWKKNGENGNTKNVKKETKEEDSYGGFFATTGWDEHKIESAKRALARKQKFDGRGEMTIKDFVDTVVKEGVLSSLSRTNLGDHGRSYGLNQYDFGDMVTYKYAKYKKEQKELGDKAPDEQKTISEIKNVVKDSLGTNKCEIQTFKQGGSTHYIVTMDLLDVKNKLPKDGMKEDIKAALKKNGVDVKEIWENVHPERWEFSKKIPAKYKFNFYVENNSSGMKKSFADRIADIMQKSEPAEPKHDLEYYKKWALSILDKQKEEPEETVDEPNEETVVKALIYTEMIAKAGYPVGTIREWKGKKYIKIAPNQWKPKYDKMDRGAKMSLSHLKKAVAKCDSEEELFNLINTNASRFRDENGHPLPEVQELHDIVTKRQAEINPQESGAGSEETGKVSAASETTGIKGNNEKKEKMSVADKIAAIQKMGKKGEAVAEKLGSGNVEGVAEDAGNDTINGVKNAVSKNEKQQNQKGSKAEPENESGSEPEKEMTDEEKEEPTSAKNFTKLQLKQAYNMIGMKGNKSLDQLKADLEKYPDSPKNKAALMLIDKLGKNGDTQENMDKLYESIENGTVDSFGNNKEAKETFESLSEQYKNTTDPDEREKILEKMTSLDKEDEKKILPAMAASEDESFAAWDKDQKTKYGNKTVEELQNLLDTKYKGIKKYTNEYQEAMKIGDMIQQKKQKSKKDEEGLSNRGEDEQDKRIGGSALWDQHIKNAIKSGNVDRIKTAIAQVENEYNELSKKAKYQDEKEFLMYELKFRKRDAENAIKELQNK